ncbi:WD repeat-containing protein 89 [Rhynchospora pubera]|uniref:WD repeat-containing protein 89 n=1 Tax=Rhynchospora pubera TaxID=906938 RepID=A0AAV8FCM2_9POAL|nr:WD repeat-containing protein 89 [Rhynchospora pubera]
MLPGPRAAHGCRLLKQLVHARLTGVGCSSRWSTRGSRMRAAQAESGQYFGECKGHSGRIHEISFSAPASSLVLCSCSSDGTVRAWDARSLEQVSMLRAGPSQEIFIFSFGGSSGNILAAGSNSQVLFWDWRNGKQVACLEESHMDDVTHVQFVPGQQNKLISSSVDGLLCLFDTDGEINDDCNLISVMNVETSVAKVGFFGNENQKLWCLTHIETLKVDYFVDCHYSSTEDLLWLIGGTSSGTLGYFPIKQNSNGTRIGAVEAILEGGHIGVVRSVLPASSDQISRHGSQNGQSIIFSCWMVYTAPGGDRIVNGAYLDGLEGKMAGFVAGFLENQIY